MEAKFISNVDPDDASAVLDAIDVAHALFILVSKSGTTLETLTNQSFVMDALKKRGLDPEIAAMSAMLHDLAAYKSGSYDDHAHRGAELARAILGELGLTDEKEMETICSAIYHHDDKLAVDSPMDEVLKDADVIHHCMNDLSKAVKDKEKARFEALCREFGMD